MKESVLVIGGDKRYYIAAELIADLGFTVYICGFEMLANNPKLKEAQFSNLPCTDYVLLPAPYQDMDGIVKMPYSETRIKLSAILPELNQNACVILGGVDWEVQKMFDTMGIAYYDLLSDETYTVKNAFITSQAAVMLAASKSAKALSDCNILVCGYGRIGKTLTRLLYSYGCRVTVSARKDKDLEWIGITGCKPVYTNEIEKVINDQDIIFNTIPFCVLDQKELVHAKKNVLIMELASKPFGINFEEASKLGLNTYIELGLPGRCFPCSAAKTVAEAFQRVVKRGW